MAIMSSRLIRHEMCKEELKRLGARVLDIQGIMFYVKFKINGTKISYVYHLNKDNTFFLERIKPYTCAIGDYDSEEDVIDTIRVDIKQFKNAMNSSNFESFIEVDQHISKLVRLFEDLYLYYNVSKEDINQVNTEINKVLEMINDVQEKSERVYFEKDPDVLCKNCKF
ncbi:hypothetical protein [Fusibacter sp. JL216-2]|uniref:hypothetical protein n=1 Tax=Fusibacter sp. JL216-2 TaxID=3071453 RepID=UPI003D342A51